MQTMTIRKLADRSGGERVVMFDPETGAKKLVNPDTSGEDHEPWPLAGISIVGETPTECQVPTSWVENGAAEGWLTLEGERIVRRPGGPADDRWRVVHKFAHLDRVVLHTVDGDLSYRVTHQPDKYAAEGGDETPVTGELYAAGATRVDWFYVLELER